MKNANLTENSWDGILQSGEELLWQGQPETSLSLSDIDIAGGLMGLFFMGFSVVWMGIAGQAGGPFWMFGLIFFFVGLRNSFGQVLLDPWERAETYYSLSNRRAFIASRKLFRGKTLKTYVIDKNTALKLVRGKTDTIYFAADQHYGHKGHKFKTKVGFEKLANGDEAYRVLAQIKSGEV